MNLRSEIARLAQDVASLRGGGSGGGPLQLICIHGGIPTASGRPEAKIGGKVFVLEPDEEVEEFKERVATEARLLGLSFAVISGLPSRDKGGDDLG